ncbi:hypothetical protein [Amycolatopsis sp. H20-H5]|uniref:hypothetical protein n=1 Tax=Amycolatopsis sp. H20-H5 TaxID=3046309 RepID=UPI002DB9704B|nr:hypothetical protein [Amycolatopsis sp. H20-H5]MEC3974735.1 hypothetical protein [Amycolatopsis sp. H20-H5]
MTDDWHRRLSTVGWYFAHLDDVCSDMSAYHRIENLDGPAAVFLSRMVRLPVYGGAVAFAAREAAEEPEPLARPTPVPLSEPVTVKPHSRGELAALNQSREYGPLGSNQQVGIFDLG